MRHIAVVVFALIFIFSCSKSKSQKLQEENRRLQAQMAELEKKIQLERENRQLQEKIRQLESQGGRASDSAQQVAEQAGGQLVSVLSRLGDQLSTDEASQKYRATMDMIRRIGAGIEMYRTDHAEPPRGETIYQLMQGGGLVPAYLKIPVLQDAWGCDLNYQTRMIGGHRSYWIGSGGSDGSFAGFDQVWNPESGAGTDIIYSNGEFVLQPLANE